MYPITKCKEVDDSNKIDQLLLGSVNTIGTLMSDGSRSFAYALGKLNSGDLVLFITNLWHNK